MSRMEVLRPVPLPYCAGCGHTTLHRLIAEALEELDLRERTIGVCSVGTTFLMYDFFNVDFCSAPPGRALSVATGLKRAQPQAAVFSYQGDGDGIGAGIGDLVHAVARGEKVTAFLVNNLALGLSGGQASPTTPVEGVTPVKVCEMLAAMGTTARVERVALDSERNVEAAGAAVREAFRHPLDGKGAAVLEVMSPCAACAGMTPEAATARWEKVKAGWPLGVLGGKK